MLSGAEIVGTALVAAQTAEILLKELNAVKEKLKPFTANVKGFRIDYLNRSTEIKYLLLIPNGIKRQLRRKIDIPAITGFRFDEMWDLDSLELVNYSWAFNGESWLLDITKLPPSERFMLTVKGKISENFLNQLVSVKVAENPSREEENDRYWIHSALINVEILKNVWKSLDIEQVDANVRIGVERMFSAAIPEGFKERLELQQKLLNAIATGNRNLEQRLKVRYRTSPLNVNPLELNALLGSLVSSDTFAKFIEVKLPFIVNNIEPVRDIGMFIPEKVKVGVQTDLNYQTPTVSGDLCFYRHKYSQLVAEKVKSVLSKKGKQ